MINIWPAYNPSVNYRSGNKYSDLRMGPSESSSQSSRVPQVCGRASEVWSGVRSARLTLGTRADRVAFKRSARSKKTFPSKKKNFHGGRLEAGFPLV